MDIQKIALDKIKMATYNPRKDLKPGDVEYQKLKRSIEEFGYVEPVVWNKRTGNIVGGHQRYKVLLELGYSEVECVVLDIDALKEKALNVALNKITGEWDVPLLSELLAQIGESGFDISLTGFDMSELDELFREGTSEAVIEDDFNVADEVKNIVNPISKRGDVWLLEKHRLRCGDSTLENEVSDLMDGTKAKLIVTDSPYNVSYNSGSNSNHPSWKKREGIMNDSMPSELFREFLNKAFTCAYNSIVPGGAIFAFMSAQEWGRFMPTLEEIGWHWSSTIIWVKDSLVLGRKDWQPRYEGMFYGWRGDAPRLYPLKETRTETDVWEFNRPKKSPLHPTQKPLDVLGKAIKFCSRKNDIVLDLFSGSASTLIAAEQLNRICYTMELDERFVDVGVKRYVEYTHNESNVFLLRGNEKIPYIEVQTLVDSLRI